MGGNGYRLSEYRKLKDCNMKTMEASVLLNLLGRPNKIRDLNYAKILTYTVYDYNYTDTIKNKYRPYGYDVLNFFIDSTGKNITKRTVGSGDY